MSAPDHFTAALNARGPNNVYIAHLKVYESAEGGGGAQKVRYIIASVNAQTRKGALYKAKRNANASLSIGKEWDLATLRELHLESVRAC